MTPSLQILISDSYPQAWIQNKYPSSAVLTVNESTSLQSVLNTCQNNHVILDLNSMSNAEKIQQWILKLDEWASIKPTLVIGKSPSIDLQDLSIQAEVLLFQPQQMTPLSQSIEHYRHQSHAKHSFIKRSPGDSARTSM